MRQIRILASATTALALAAPLGASTLEEVVVTATRRASTVQDTPLAITAFDASALERFSIDNAQDLATRTPSLSITGTPSKISLRGVGRPNNALGSDPGVAIYSDGVYVTEATLLEFTNLFDTERVEVLRGPQGTLYGRNAVGGAINLVSMAPTVTWHSRVNVELGNYDYRALQGLISGPITDQLSMVVSGSTLERDGFQRAAGGADMNDRNADYLRMSFKYHWTNNWYSRIQYSWTDMDRRPANGYRTLPFSTDYVQVVNDSSSSAPLNPPGLFPGQNFINYHQGYRGENPALADPDRVATDLLPAEHSDSDAVYLLNEWALGDYRLKYLASWYEYRYDQLLDGDGISAADSGLDWSQLTLLGRPVSDFTGIRYTPPQVSEVTDQRADFIAHDIQFYSELGGPLEFVSGIYYYQSDEDQQFAVHEANDDLMSVYRFFGDLLGLNTSDAGWLYRGQSRLETTATALYGQATLEFGGAWQATAGLRYSHDKKAGGDETFVQWVGSGAIQRHARDSWDSVDWRLGLDYRPGANQLLYGVLATGYRSGGFNFMKPTDATTVDTVDPEDLLSLEVGYKAALWQQRLQLAAAAYLYDYRDLQVIRGDLVNGVSLRSFDNADRARAWGLELEATAQLTQGLQAGGAWSYNRSAYRDYESFDTNACALGPLARGDSQDPLCTTAQSLDGNSFPLTPEHKLSLFASYGWQWRETAMAVTVNYLYVGEQTMSPFDDRRYDRVDAYDRWDLSLAARWGEWSATAFAKNIGDDREWVFRERPSTVIHSYGSSGQLTEPRTYGVRLSYAL